MNPENELFSAIRRTGRLLPSFALLAVAGCAVARLLFGVPAQYLGVVVAVPLTGVFLISRVLRIVIPPTPVPTHERRQIPRLFVYFGLGAFFGALVAIDLLLSAFVYGYLKLPATIVTGTLYGAGISASLSAISITAAAFLILRKVMARFSSSLKAGVWRILSCPAVLAEIFFDQHFSKQ